MAEVRLAQVVGWSGSGKTTLLEAVIPLLRARGLRVFALKHSGGFPELDRAGKDSHRLRAAGAEGVVLVGPERSALFVDHAPGFFPWHVWARTFAQLGADLVLFESFGSAPLPRIEVWRAEHGESGLRSQGDPLLSAVVAAADPPGWSGPRLRPEDTERIADLLLAIAAPLSEVEGR